MTKRRLAMERLLAGEDVAATTPEPRVRVAAVRSMGLSLERLEEARREGETRIVEIDPRLCDPSFVRDRLEDAGEGGEEDPAAIASLQASIEESGQAVPILVRPAPGSKGRYQIAYGHRRWRACRALRRPVRAIVATLSDEELVLAQGRENNERRDLTFIERAQFAAALVERGVSRQVIGKGLGIDKSELARLLAVANGLPEGLAAAIGRAPKVGRPRWLALVALVRGRGGEKALALAREHRALPSDARFAAVMDGLSATSPPAPRKPGPVPAKVDTKGDTTRITITDPAFGAFVAKRLAALHADFSKAR